MRGLAVVTPLVRETNCVPRRRWPNSAAASTFQRHISSKYVLHILTIVIATIPMIGPLPIQRTSACFFGMVVHAAIHPSAPSCEDCSMTKLSFG